MGNPKFKLSDMIPNVWFHKLKYMAKHKEEHNPKLITNKTNYKLHSTPSSLQSNPPQNRVMTTQQQQQQPHLSEQRKSYYFNRDLTEKKISDPPRKSSRRRIRLSTKRSSTRIYNSSPRLQVSSSVSAAAGHSCRSTTFESAVSTTQPNDSIITPIFRTFSSSDQDDDNHSPSWSTSCQCSVKNDSFISIDDDDDDDDYGVDDTKEYNHTSSNISNELVHQTIPPIITKKKPKGPMKNLRTSSEFHEPKTRFSVKVAKEETTSTWSASKRNNHDNKTKNVLSTSPARLSLSSASSSSQCGVRLRTNSPRMRIQTRHKTVGSTKRASVSQSFAVVKASKDPERDFRKSMVEMIVENDITKSKDLEELLSCYLSLNSDEYHGMIINVFSQIWFEFVRVRLN